MVMYGGRTPFHVSGVVVLLINIWRWPKAISFVKRTAQATRELIPEAGVETGEQATVPRWCTPGEQNFRTEAKRMRRLK